MRAEAELAFGEHRLLLAPTLPFVAPPPTSTRRRAPSFVQFTYPFNALGWPALALPAGPAEDGFRHRCSVGRPGDDAYVLSAGLALEASLDADLRFAHMLADAADDITLKRFRALDLRVDTKPDLTPVSDADRAAEEAIRALVASSGRGESVYGEEFGDDGGDAKWIVDPIDGTKSYVRGVPIWATLLALERDGVVVLELVSAPTMTRRWWAARGEGGFANGERCRVSEVARLEDAVVSTTSQRGMPSGWQTIVERSWSNRGYGDFWQYCLVAEG